MFTFVYMSKLKSETSSLVRISRKYIKMAIRAKKSSGTPIGKIFEQALVEKIERQKVSEQIGNVITQPKD